MTSTINFTSYEGEGSVALSANALFIKNIAQMLLETQIKDKLNASEAADIMGEMTNQVIGRMKTALSNKGSDISIGLPEVIVKKNPTDYHHTDNPIVFAPFGLDNFGCDIEFAIRKGKLNTQRNKGERREQISGKWQRDLV